MLARGERIEIGIVFGIQGVGYISAFQAVEFVSGTGAERGVGGWWYKRRKGEEEWEVGGRVGGKYARCARAGSRGRSSENLISPYSFHPPHVARVVLEFSKNRVERGIFDEPSRGRRQKKREFAGVGRRRLRNPKLRQLFQRGARSACEREHGNCV